LSGLEHEEAFERTTPAAGLFEQAFLRLGLSATTYHDGAEQHRGRGAGHHLQRILRLADRHGSSVVSGAMANAARHGNSSADAVARVIVGRELRDRTAVGPAPCSRARATTARRGSAGVGLDPVRSARHRDPPSAARIIAAGRDRSSCIEPPLARGGCAARISKARTRAEGTRTTGTRPRDNDRRRVPRTRPAHYTRALHPRTRPAH
jgi:hypothetical protein